MTIATVKADKVKLDTLSSDPSGSEGFLYYNSVSKKLKLNNGSGFNEITGGASSILEVTNNYGLTSADCDGYKFIVINILKTYGFYGGGYSGSVTNVIDYINITTTTGNAIDTGDLTVARYGVVGVRGFAYGFFGGGYDISTYSNIIDYISIAVTTQNAIDRGDLTIVRYAHSGISGKLYGFYAGGSGPYNASIDWIDMTIIAGNAISKGDMPAVKGYAGKMDGNTYGYVACGSDGSTNSTVYFLDLTTTTGGASSRGNMITAKFEPAGI